MQLQLAGRGDGVTFRDAGQNRDLVASTIAGGDEYLSRSEQSPAAAVGLMAAISPAKLSLGNVSTLAATGWPSLILFRACCGR